ncbi:hypothetical protein V8E36_004968 [Tilletia maclaganii]
MGLGFACLALALDLKRRGYALRTPTMDHRSSHWADTTGQIEHCTVQIAEREHLAQCCSWLPFSRAARCSLRYSLSLSSTSAPYARGTSFVPPLPFQHQRILPISGKAAYPTAGQQARRLSTIMERAPPQSVTEPEDDMPTAAADAAQASTLALLAGKTLFQARKRRRQIDEEVVEYERLLEQKREEAVHAAQNVEHLHGQYLDSVRQALIAVHRMAAEAGLNMQTVLDSPSTAGGPEGVATAPSTKMPSLAKIPSFGALEEEESEEADDDDAEAEAEAEAGADADANARTHDSQERDDDLKHFTDSSEDEEELDDAIATGTIVLRQEAELRDLFDHRGRTPSPKASVESMMSSHLSPNSAHSEDDTSPRASLLSLTVDRSRKSSMSSAALALNSRTSSVSEATPSPAIGSSSEADFERPSAIDAAHALERASKSKIRKEGLPSSTSLEAPAPLPKPTLPTVAAARGVAEQPKPVDSRSRTQIGATERYPGPSMVMAPGAEASITASAGMAALTARLQNLKQSRPSRRRGGANESSRPCGTVPDGHRRPSASSLSDYRSQLSHESTRDTSSARGLGIRTGPVSLDESSSGTRTGSITHGIDAERIEQSDEVDAALAPSEPATISIEVPQGRGLDPAETLEIRLPETTATLAEERVPYAILAVSDAARELT